MAPEVIFMYIFVATLGLCVGSFLNVCILRIPAGESVVTGASHCVKCERKLRAWELVPVFSWLLLRGKCHGCSTKISGQYPLIEAITSVLWVLVFWRFDLGFEFLFAALLVSALLTLSIIDARTQEIPPQTTIFIFVLAVVKVLVVDMDDWLNHVLGLLVLSTILLLLYVLSGGGAIGGGDLKLMAGCGLYLGLWPVMLAFILACIIGSVIHVIRMKFFNAGRTLAMGPYLAVGVLISLLFGDEFIAYYLSLFINI